MTYLPFWLPLALAGFPPWMILTQQAISLIAGEQERVRYGLTTNIETHKPTEVAFHEYKAIARDVRTVHVARALGLHAAPPRLGAAGRLTAPRPDPRRAPRRSSSGGNRLRIDRASGSCPARGYRALHPAPAHNARVT